MNITLKELLARLATFACLVNGLKITLKSLLQNKVCNVFPQLAAVLTSGSVLPTKNGHLRRGLTQPNSWWREKPPDHGQSVSTGLLVHTVLRCTTCFARFIYHVATENKNITFEGIILGFHGYLSDYWRANHCSSQTEWSPWWQIDGFEQTIFRMATSSLHLNPSWVTHTASCW